MSSVENAAYALVHATRDSARDIAERIGMRLQILTNKVNPTNDRNHLMLSEAVAVQKAAGDHRILHAMADELGYVCLPKPEIISDDDVAHALSKMCADSATICARSMRDGKVTPNERRALESELAEMIASATNLQAVLAGKSGRAR